MYMRLWSDDRTVYSCLSGCSDSEPQNKGINEYVTNGTYSSENALASGAECNEAMEEYKKSLAFYILE